MEQNQDAPIYLAEREGKPLLVLQENVDVFWAEKLHQTALHMAEQNQDVVVNCEKTEQLSSAAFQVLLALQQRVHQASGLFHLEKIPAVVLQQLQIAGLENVFSMEANNI